VRGRTRLGIQRRVQIRRTLLEVTPRAAGATQSIREATEAGVTPLTAGVIRMVVVLGLVGIIRRVAVTLTVGLLQVVDPSLLVRKRGTMCASLPILRISLVFPRRRVKNTRVLRCHRSRLLKDLH